jgi:hypothetical protein
MGNEYSLPLTNNSYMIERQSNARNLNYQFGGDDISNYINVSYIEYTTPGTYTITVPNIASYIAVVLIGGGGSGGNGGWGSNGSASFGTGGGGGGAGATIITKAIPITPSSTVSLTVGGGGSPGSFNGVIPYIGTSGAETSISIGGVKRFGAGGGYRGNSGWNQNSVNINTLPNNEVRGLGGTGGTIYQESNYSIYYQDGTNGDNGDSAYPTRTSTTYIRWGASGGGRTKDYGTLSIDYNAVGGNGFFIGTGLSGTGYGAGGGGGGGTDIATNDAGGTGGAGNSGYARIYFYI